MAKALTSGAAEGQMQKEPYAGKAHERIPEFSGKAVDYKEYRKRLTLYEKKMSLAMRQCSMSLVPSKDELGAHVKICRWMS